MNLRLSFPLALFVFARILIAPSAAQIAVTECLNNPEGDDEIREFFELYNYSSDPVNIANWTIADEDFNSIVLTTQERFIPSGGYLVFSVNKAQMETDYFGSLPQLDIIQYDGTSAGFQMANSGDEIVLSNASDAIVWSLAYMNDDVSGRATFLSENDFTTIIWGSKAEPGIVRAGDDLTTGTLGYESNDATEDPNATTTENGDTASPLAGFYTTGGGPVTQAGFRILSIVPGLQPDTWDITFESELGQTYAVDLSTDLTEQSFDEIVPTTGTGDTTTINAPANGQPRAFYRVRETTIVIAP